VSQPSEKVALPVPPERGMEQLAFREGGHELSPTGMLGSKLLLVILTIVVRNILTNRKL